MDETIELRTIFGLLQRQFRLIAVTVLLVVAAAALIAFSLTPIYSSSALILVDPARKDLLDPETQGFSTGSDSAKVDSEVEILRSNNVLLRVVQSQDLVKEVVDNWAPSLRERILATLRLGDLTPPTAEEAVTQALQGLRRNLTVQRVGLTYVISVQVRSPDPQRAADLANAVAEAYVSEQLQSKVSNVLASRDIMQGRIGSARQHIVESEGAFDSYINSNIDRIVAETGRTELASLQRQIGELTQARQQSAALAETLQASVANNDINAIVQSLQDDAVRQLEQRRNELNGQIANADPAIAIDLQSELQSIDEQLRTAAVSQIDQLQNQVAQTQEQEEQTRQRLRSSAVSSGLPAEMLTELFDLQQGAELARQQYQRLLGLEQDLSTRASLQVADSRIVSPALVDERAVFPNRPLILTLAGIAAIGLGVLLAFAYENLIGGFTREDQTEAVLKAKVPAAIPRQKGSSNEISALMVNSPLSVFAESIRRLRAAIDQAKIITPGAADRRSQVIMVSSTAPNEGKTTVALSLARSYATSGRKVLLIDADLRKPSIHRHVGIESSVGLLEFLNSDPENAPEIQSIITTDTLTKAILLLGSGRSGVPTDHLVTLPAFERLLKSARQAFEVVIVDTPPVGPVVDALYVAPLTDAIVFVTKWASTSQMDAKAALNSLKEAAPETAVFVALNQQIESRIAYQRKYGGYYVEA
ncbi:GumC family protein [Devosia submarina]|uniref:GumC family protein n=1 Tax=Devosia submarina TaxID=1173082 RepID=UPI000D3B18E2|nr:Wzz/FepE/Etk N-terminal domain-containing protein [Devosia submarina]